MCLFLTEESRYACSVSLENPNNSLRDYSRAAQIQLIGPFAKQ
jgi:hypothetical protein